MADKPKKSKRTGLLTRRQEMMNFRKWQNSLTSGKEFYTRADEAFAKLVEHFGVGEHSLSDGTTIIISDQFQERDGTPRKKVFGTAGVPRFKGEFRKAV